MTTHLRCRVDGEFQLGLLPVVYGKPLHKQRSESGAGASTKTVEDKKALKSGALVCEFADSVQNQVHDLLADGVVTAGVVVGSVFLARYELLWMEELSVGASANFVQKEEKRVEML